MNYQNEDVTKRAMESPLWPDVDTQQGKALPYLLERYLLLENWKFIDRLTDPDMEDRHSSPFVYDIQYLHLLMAEAVTVLLSQEDRLRDQERRIRTLEGDSNP